MRGFRASQASAKAIQTRFSMQFARTGRLGRKTNWQEAQAHDSKSKLQAIAGISHRLHIEAYSSLMILYRSRPRLIPKVPSLGFQQPI